jgi:hypothetical protein
MKDVNVIEEIRAFREAYAAQFNYDIDAISRDLREQAKREGRKLISFPPRRPEGWVEHPDAAKRDGDAWDRQIEEDAAAGKLDALAAEALAEYEAGQASEL